MKHLRTLKIINQKPQRIFEFSFQSHQGVVYLTALYTIDMEPKKIWRSNSIFYL
jgi:hypothetical protein